MDGGGPSEELQEVEEELVNKKGENIEHDDVLDVEAGVKKPATSTTSFAAENMKVFTQVMENSHTLPFSLTLFYLFIVFENISLSLPPLCCVLLV